MLEGLSSFESIYSTSFQHNPHLSWTPSHLPTPPPSPRTPLPDALLSPPRQQVTEHLAVSAGLQDARGGVQAVLAQAA